MAIKLKPKRDSTVPHAEKNIQLEVFKELSLQKARKGALYGLMQEVENRESIEKRINLIKN
jgi:hypothetical protein